MQQRKPVTALLLLILLLAALLPLHPAFAGSLDSSTSPTAPQAPDVENAYQNGNRPLFLPLVSRRTGGQVGNYLAGLRVNAPYFQDSFNFGEAAIFWFGSVTDIENYADVRVGYTSRELVIHVAVIDKYLWYQRRAQPQDFVNWDAVSVFLNLNGSQGGSLDGNSYRFDAMLNWDEADPDYQAAYRGQSGGWSQVSIPFTALTNWRGQAPNDNAKADSGWTMRLAVPFSSLGVSGPPAKGTVWGLALKVHDRDNKDDGPLTAQVWPPAFQETVPASWGQLAFGLPEFQVVNARPGGTVKIRHGSNGARVVDAMVGGGTNCGDHLRWGEWGWRNWAGTKEINIQNQGDLADWLCFSKYYVTFPLDSVPPGKVLISAKVTLYQFGNAGGGQWGDPPDSVIQVLTAAAGWDEHTINWNNAPLAGENISMTRVQGLKNQPPWPGVARTWDVSVAAAQAYANGQSLNLVFYSADAPRHTGKYFVSSDAADWNQTGRPTLEIVWGEP